MIQKQPGVTDQKWEVFFENKKVFDGELKTDKMIKLK